MLELIKLGIWEGFRPQNVSVYVLKFELFVDKSGCMHCWEFYILSAFINANKITINRVYETTSYPGLLWLKEYKMKHNQNYDALSRVIRYISNKTLSTSLNAASAKKASFMSNFSPWLVQCIAINHPRSTRNRVETPTVKNG